MQILCVILKLNACIFGRKMCSKFKLMMLSERDSFMFGFFLKFAFQLKLMCISDIFKGKDRKFYQVGFLCVKVGNTTIEQDIAVLCEKEGTELLGLIIIHGRHCK